MKNKFILLLFFLAMLSASSALQAQNHLASMTTAKEEGDSVKLDVKWKGKGRVSANGSLLENGSVTFVSVPDSQTIVLTSSGDVVLEYLECGDNGLTSLDVSNLSALKNLTCSDNQLTSLDASNLWALEHLDCYNNQIRTLNLSGCLNLNYVDAGLQSIEMSIANNETNFINPISYTNQTTAENIIIDGIDYAYNAPIPISLLDDSRFFESATIGSEYPFSGTIKINWVGRFATMKTDKAVNEKIGLKTAWIGNGSIRVNGTTINNDTLTPITVPENQFFAIATVGDVHLKSFDCSSNELTALEWVGSPEVESINCSKNKLTDIDVNDISGLESLDCSENELTILYLNNLLAFTELHCQTNHLKKLELLGCTALKRVDAGNQTIEIYVGANVTSIDVPVRYVGITDFEPMLVGGNSYTYSASVPINAATDNLAFTSPPIGSGIPFCGNVAIKRGTVLAVMTTAIAEYFHVSIGVEWSGDGSIRTYDTKLNNYIPTQISVPANQTITLLAVGDVKMETLECPENQLTSLDVSGNAALRKLYCSNNKLKTLNLSGCSGLSYVDARDQRIDVLVAPNATSFANPILYTNPNGIEKVLIGKTLYAHNATIPITQSNLGFTSTILGSGIPFSGTIVTNKTR